MSSITHSPPSPAASLASMLRALTIDATRADRWCEAGWTLQATPWPPGPDGLPALMLTLQAAPPLRLPRPRGCIVLHSAGGSTAAWACLEDTGGAWFPAVPPGPLTASWQAAPPEPAVLPFPSAPGLRLAAAPPAQWLPADTGHPQFMADFYPGAAQARVVITSPSLPHARVRFRIGEEWATAQLQHGQAEITLRGAHPDFDGLLEQFAADAPDHTPPHP